MEFLSSFSLETQIFTSVILFIWVCINLRFTHKAAILGPSLLTTAGIFATFLGIAIGLLDFDAKNIQSSIPALIDGLRLAFWASVFGVGAALLVKIRFSLLGARKNKNDNNRVEGATIDDLANHLIAVQKALVGGDDSTLITQFKLGRQENNDRLDRMRSVIENFTETMAENNSKALIEALEGVMRDFNSKINEQFGENFKQLNKAVGDILVWQERYREQMGEMIVLQERNTKSLEQASLRLEAVVENSESYTQTARDLAVLLQGIEVQRATLQESMKALGELFVTASQGLPEIESRIVGFADQIARSAQQASADMASAARSGTETLRASVGQVVNDAAEQLAALNEAVKSVEATVVVCANQIREGSAKANEIMVQSAQENAAAFKSALADSQKAMAGGIATTNEAMLKNTQEQTSAQKAAIIEVQKVLSEAVKSANENFNSQIQEMISKTREQVAALDVALQEELTNSLNTLGRQLTALSQQFVNDYSPLTDRLRELVAVAGKV